MSEENMKQELIRVEGVKASPEGASWSFAVSPGDAVWIEEARDSDFSWLDWLTGIVEPPLGAVRWKGRSWPEMTPGEAAGERGRIGAVFARGGMVVNLDMDENVWLPARIHRLENAEEQIARWAEFFGCSPLPAVRASTLPERVRRRILWVRAFAGQPELLVLEQPLLDMPADDRPRFFEAVGRLRASGCAVIWLDEQLAPDTLAALDPLTHVPLNGFEGVNNG